MPPRYASTCSGFAARIASTTGSSDARVGDRLLVEIRLRVEAGVADVRDRLVERLARDAPRAPDELRELRGIHRPRVDACADELVRDDVGGRDRLGARGDRRLPERVEAPGHEHERPLVVEPLGDPTDPRRGQLGQLRAQPLDELRRRLDGDEVGLREVPVVVRLLLRPPGVSVPARDVEVVGVLLDRATGLPHLDLPRDLRLDPAADVS